MPRARGTIENNLSFEVCMKEINRLDSLISSLEGSKKCDWRTIKSLKDKRDKYIKRIIIIQNDATNKSLNVLKVAIH